MTPAIAATLVAGAALLLAGVRIKWLDDKAARFVERTHIPLPTEDR